MSAEPVVDPIFIFAVMGRSGTNFLADLLALHPRCHTPKAPFYEDFFTYSSRHLIAYVSELESLYADKSFPGVDEVRAPLLEAIGTALLSVVGDGLPAGRRVILKTPHPRGLVNFRSLFPGCKVVVLLRDGRMVIESNARSFGMSLESCIKGWNDNAAQMADLLEDRAPGHHVVRYEDLCSDPERELRGLFAYLGITAAEYDFGAARALPVRGSCVFGRAGTDLNWEPTARNHEFDALDRIGHWTRREHEMFQRIAGRSQRRLGYDTGFDGTCDRRTAMARNRLDISVIVSIKIDTPDRLENLGRLLDFYDHFFTSYELILIEQGAASRLKPLIGARSGSADADLLHHLLPTADCHWKTRNLNLGAKLATRGRLLFTDCDVVPHPDALPDALQAMDGGVSSVRAFNGVLVQIRKDAFETARDWPSFRERLVYFPRDHDTHPQDYDTTDMEPLYGNSRYAASGGCMLCDRRDFFVAGGWNENIVSYGFEDMEFLLRLERLGWYVHTMDGYNAYHFEHERGRDSVYNNFYRINEAEYERVLAMDREELEEYVCRGFRRIPFVNDEEYRHTNTKTTFGWGITRSSSMRCPELRVVILADAQRVPYSQSGLREFLDHLEAHFFGYEVLICEFGSRGYEYIDSKLGIRYQHVAAISEAQGWMRSMRAGMEGRIVFPIALWCVDWPDVYRRFDAARLGSTWNQVLPSWDRVTRDLGS